MKTVSAYRQDETGQWWFYFPDGRRIRASERACEECGTAFLHYKATQRYCSVPCRGRAREVLHPRRYCVNCQATFAPIVKSQRYCSHSCAATAYHARQDVTTNSSAPIKNIDNERYRCDERGQWWYTPDGAPRTRAKLKVCPECSSTFLSNIFHKDTECCSKRCAQRVFHRKHPGHLARERSSRWKGGTIKDEKGYVLQLSPDHPSLTGTMRRYVLQHRLVMEQKLGRLLRSDEVVHHLNGIRDDNRPENLELWAFHHPPGQRVTDTEHE